MFTTKPIPKATQTLAVKWLKGDLTTTELATALGKKQAWQALYSAALALRAAWKAGTIK